MTTITATNARREFFDILKGASINHEIYRIHHRRGDAVLMSEDEYESLLETLELLSTPGFKGGLLKAAQEVEAGETVDFEEVFGEPL